MVCMYHSSVTQVKCVWGRGRGRGGLERLEKGGVQGNGLDCIPPSVYNLSIPLSMIYTLYTDPPIHPSIRPLIRPQRRRCNKLTHCTPLQSLIKHDTQFQTTLTHTHTRGRCASSHGQAASRDASHFRQTDTHSIHSLLTHRGVRHIRQGGVKGLRTHTHTHGQTGNPSIHPASQPSTWCDRVCVCVCGAPVPPLANPCIIDHPCVCRHNTLHHNTTLDDAKKATGMARHTHRYTWPPCRQDRQHKQTG